MMTSPNNHIAPDNIQSLKKNEVFVFGSNIEGHHGGGAAYFAFRTFGAEWGVLIFLVTAVGCGIAGYSPREVAPMFQEAVNVPNVYLPKCFWDVIDE